MKMIFDPIGSTDNKPAFVQAMAWRQTADMPLPGSMMTHFIDAYMRHFTGYVVIYPNCIKVRP